MDCDYFHVDKFFDRFLTNSLVFLMTNKEVVTLILLHLERKGFFLMAKIEDLGSEYEELIKILDHSDQSLKENFLNYCRWWRSLLHFKHHDESISPDSCEETICQSLNETMEEYESAIQQSRAPLLASPENKEGL